MLPDKSDLKLLSSSPAGLRALMEYLEATRDHYDNEYGLMARKLVFAPEGRDAAVVMLGRRKAVDDLIRDINSMTSIRGDK